MANTMKTSIFAKQIDTVQRHGLNNFTPAGPLFCLVRWQDGGTAENTRFDLSATDGQRVWSLQGERSGPARQLHLWWRSAARAQRAEAYACLPFWRRARVQVLGRPRRGKACWARTSTWRRAAGRCARQTAGQQQEGR